MREVQILVKDDLDGSPDATTVQFGWQGKAYEIDLSDQHLKELSELLRPYVDVARPVETRKRSSAPPSQQRTYGRYKSRKAQLTRIRDWAATQGLELPNKARVPYAIHNAYNEQHPDDVIPLADAGNHKVRRQDDEVQS